MCGLVGVIDPTIMTAVDKQAFRILLKIDEIRGPHSTGVAVGNGPFRS